MTLWNDIDIEDYFHANYLKWFAQDLFILAHLVSFYQKYRPQNCVEVGAGPVLFPTLCALPFCKKYTVYEPVSQSVNYLMEQRKKIHPRWYLAMDIIENILGKTVGLAKWQKWIQKKLIVIEKPLGEIEATNFDTAAMFYVAEAITDGPMDFGSRCEDFLNLVKLNGHYTAVFSGLADTTYVGTQPKEAFYLEKNTLIKEFGDYCKIGELDILTDRVRETAKKVFYVEGIRWL